MKTFIQFGAGNIGRSFLGQLFSRGGYEVVFIDIDEELISELNARKSYRVIIKSDREEEIPVDNVRGVSGRDPEAVAEEIAGCSLMGTSVGKGALPHIMKPIALGLQKRKPGNPLDIIIAENIQNGSQLFRSELKKHLPEDFPLEEMTGLIETSIGKMVPIMKQEDTARDRLWVFAEPYNNLILDRKAFRNPIPEIDGLSPKDNIKAYVDRKLFIHNLGHAASAYFGYLEGDGIAAIWEVMENPVLREKAESAMQQSRDALLAEYPDEFTKADLDDHIEDLLTRFANRHLGDTIFRVGRDLPRKLSRNDRLTGAMLLCAKHTLPFDRIAEAAASAFFFRAQNEAGATDPKDDEFHTLLKTEGMDSVCSQILGLDRTDTSENRIIESVKAGFDKINSETRQK